MTTVSPFDLLGDDVEDPSQHIETEQLKVAVATAAAPKKGQQPATVILVALSCFDSNHTSLFIVKLRL
ncbi:unnamed protein product [Lupinus luteus]|uniref:STM1-like N-terminal domain-containing protein n=1 Tax=Lupinus luteus TaxID=3873 RepID=A0AAV1W1P2_LUPLU